MSFLLKNSGVAARSGNTGDKPILYQVIRVSRPTAALPASTTATIFNVEGGRIALLGLIGEVTTAIQAQACNLSINVDADSGATDVIAATVDVNGLALGGTYIVEGDGTAGVITGVGWGQFCLTPVVICPGIITLTASATNTGSMKWDLYYFPLDEAAYVTL